MRPTKHTPQELSDELPFTNDKSGDELSGNYHAIPQNDRLKRWCVGRKSAHLGNGSIIVAENIRTQQEAERMAAAWNAMAGIDNVAEWANDRKGLYYDLLVLKQHNHELLSFIRKVKELGYTHGDKVNKASEAMFELYVEADELLNQCAPIKTSEPDKKTIITVDEPTISTRA